MRSFLAWRLVCGIGLAVGIQNPPHAEETAPPAVATSTPADKPANPPGAKYQLAYKFRPGEIVGYEVVHSMEILSQFNGASETAKNRTETHKHYQVVAVNEKGHADLELVIDWVRMSARFNNDPAVEFDSADPDSNPAKYKHIRQWIGKTQAKMQFDASGKLVKIHKLAPDNAGPKTPAEAAAAAAGQPLEGESHKTFLLLLPTQPIAVGEEWKETFEVPVTVEEKLTQNVRLMRVCKLTKVDGSLATITHKTVVITPVNNPQITAQLSQREISGDVVFDLEAGAIVSRSANVDKAIIAPFGPKTAMHTKSTLVERRIPANELSVKAPEKVPAATEKK